MHGGEDGKGSQAGTSRGEGKTITEKSERNTGYDGTQVLQKQKKLLTDMKFKAYPDENGDFSGVFELRAGVFGTGTYLIKANYFGHNFEKSVTIIDNSLKGGLSPELFVNIDRPEYVPGETVRISGGINNAYYYDNVSIIIETPDVLEINCLSGQQCGFGNTEQKLRVQEGVEGPTFYWNYKIPKFDTALGKYQIIVDTHFGQTTKEFFVVNESEGKKPEQYVIRDINPNLQRLSATQITPNQTYGGGGTTGGTYSNNYAGAGQGSNMSNASTCLLYTSPSPRD